MGTLLFDSLEIRGFRAFQHLRIEKLGRVNLIVGQNNVGKSCLLEALQVYANRGNPSFLWQLLGAHDQDTRFLLGPLEHHDDELLSSVKKLFHGWPEMTGFIPPIEIGPINSPTDKLQLSIGFSASRVDEQGQTMLQLLPPDKHKNIEHAIPCFSVQVGENQNVVYPLETTSASEPLKSEIRPINCIAIDTNDLNKGKISELWDNISSPDLHQEIVKALRILAPGLDGASIIRGVTTKRERIPVITVPTIPEALPIRVLGSGMQRMLTIILSLLNAKDGLLLIDEIENGLHHTAQVELWQLIFEMSHRLNIQVFATTHSWDCILSFQHAVKAAIQRDKQDAKADEQAEARLIRLNFKKSGTSATLYDEQLLTSEAGWDIEVR